MKRLIVLICVGLLCCFAMAYGKINPYILGGSQKFECDHCTGGLIFAWHMEDATVNDSSDFPCGCVSPGGDNEASIGGATICGTQYQDGDESLCITNDYDSATFDVGSGCYSFLLSGQ